MFGFDCKYASPPRDYATCNGAEQTIASNSALFSLIGTTYGGDGRTKFNLPDMRGRMPRGTGTGPGLEGIQIGQRGGANSVTLNVQNLPRHTHRVTVGQAYIGGNTGSSTGTGNSMAEAKVNSGPATTTLEISNVGNYTEYTGSNTPINTMSPYTTISFCIGTAGIYPSK